MAAILGSCRKEFLRRGRRRIRVSTPSDTIRLPNTQATVPSPGQVVSPASQKPGTPMSWGTARWLAFASVWRTPPTAPWGRLVKRS